MAEILERQAAARLERPDGADQAARPEGRRRPSNLQIFMANLRYFKEALAKLRAGGAKAGVEA
jgi:hypothetical protein